MQQLSSRRPDRRIGDIAQTAMRKIVAFAVLLENAMLPELVDCIHGAILGEAGHRCRESNRERTSYYGGHARELLCFIAEPVQASRDNSVNLGRHVGVMGPPRANRFHDEQRITTSLKIQRFRRQALAANLRGQTQRSALIERAKRDFRSEISKLQTV